MSFMVIETHGGTEYAAIVTDTEGKIWCLIPVTKPRMKPLIVNME